MAMLEFDDEGARVIERVYATPDIAAQRAQVLARLALHPGEDVLDVGSGPGYLAVEMAAAVGPAGSVLAVDPSTAMNAMARRRTAGLAQVRVVEGDALALPCPDASIDVAVSTQVYEYVPDVPAALAELRRVLRPGGRVVVLDTDWESLVWHVADRELQRRILQVWDGHLADPRLPRTLPGHLRRAGFRVTGRSVLPIFNAVHDEDTYSVRTIRTIAGYVTGRGGVTAEDVAAWEADLAARGAEDDYLFTLNRYCMEAVAT